LAGTTTYKEIYNLAKKAKAELWDMAESRGRDVKIYLHWTAGSYYTNFEDYNVSINAEGGLYIPEDDFAETLDHTYYRNSVLTHGEAADNEDGLDIYYPDYSGYPNNTYGPKSNVDRWDLEFLGTAESPIYNPYDETGHRGGDVLRGKANYFRVNGFTKSVLEGREMQSEEIAPNGRPYAKNDIDYLMKVGYSRESAIILLSAADKYTKPYDASMVAPNGMDYEQNDIDYLVNNGYTKESAIDLLKTTSKYRRV